LQPFVNEVGATVHRRILVEKIAGPFGKSRELVQVKPGGVAYKAKLSIRIFVKGAHVHHEGRVGQLSRGHAAPEARASVE